MLKQEPQTLAPFDPGLNAAIIDITRRVVGEFAVADTAPSTYEQLKTHLNAGNLSASLKSLVPLVTITRPPTKLCRKASFHP